MTGEERIVCFADLFYSKKPGQIATEKTVAKVRQEIGLQRGLPEDLSRKLVKQIRDEFPKVQPRVQGDAIRVVGKSKDELQRVIAYLRGLDEAVPLQFENYR